MSVSGARSTTITFTGDIPAVLTATAAVNTSSPGQVDIVTLSAGNTVITPPSGGSTPKAVVIIPPTGNAQALILKGIAGDTGVTLHLTDPSVIGLGNPAGTFVLNAAGTITGLRLIWV